MAINVQDIVNAVQSLQVTTRQITKKLGKFGDPDLLIKRVAELEGKQLSFREYTMLHAEKTIPFNYRISRTVAAADTSRVVGSVTISQEGYFFLDRIYFSWLPSEGDNANTWCPIASSNPFIAGSAGVAGAAIADTINFFYEISEGRAQRERQDNAIPGDICYRQDGDGILGPEGDAFGPNSTVQAFITPTIALTNAGTLYITLQGVQCLDYLQG